MVEVVGYVAKTVADTEKVQISGQPSGDIVWPVLYWAVNYSFSSQYQKQDGAIVVPAADVEKLYAACFAEGKLPDLENKKYIGCGDIQKQDKRCV